MELLERLDRLPGEEPFASWSRDIRAGLDRLGGVESLDSPDAVDAVESLAAVADRAETIAADAKSPELRSAVRRAGYALLKRLTVWRLVQKIGPAASTFGSDRPTDAEMRTRLARAKAHLLGHPHGAAWIRYLRLDELDRLIDANASPGDAEKSALARRILRRMHATHLSPKQSAMLAQAPVAAVDRDLRQWATSPVDLAALLARMEEHERFALSADARRTADWRCSLLWSGNPEAESLARTLEARYRNANIRIQVAGRMIDGLLPTLECLEDDVDDWIMGALVQGRSRTSTRLSVRLVPDPRRIHVELEAAGQVVSDTYAMKGPVTFFNEGASDYRAAKLFVADRRAVHVEQARANVDSQSDLTDLQTDFDGVPLIGSIVRMYAERQHDDRHCEAQAELEGRVSCRVRDRMDREIHRQLTDGERQYREKLLAPLTELELNLEPIDMQTTDTDAALRVRLAGTDQLAANTPRPTVPEGTLLCVQFHQSAVNNVIDRLELNGKETDLEGLFHHLAAAVGKPDADLPEELPEGVTLRFAPREAVRVEFCDDRVTLWIYLSLLDNGQNRWRNVTVRAFYGPSTREGDVGLARDSSIELTGKRLGIGDQVALRAIFTKVLTGNKQINIIGRRLADNPRLPKTQVSQFAITDGWISVAIAPQDRQAARPVTR